MDLNQEIPPHLIAVIDQQYERSRSGLPEVLAAARKLVELRGPAHAAALLATVHFEEANGDSYNLAGALGTVLVEMIRRETPCTR
jgi:hypothetical protein